MLLRDFAPARSKSVLSLMHAGSCGKILTAAQLASTAPYICRALIAGHQYIEARLFQQCRSW
jgi:hypothetical protein